MRWPPCNQEPLFAHSAVLCWLSVHDGCSLCSEKEKNCLPAATRPIFQAWKGVTGYLVGARQCHYVRGWPIFESWVITTCEDLDRALGLMSRKFVILHSQVLQVQYKKTQVMLFLRGCVARKWLTSHTTHAKDPLYLYVPGLSARILEVPTVSKIRYLGVVLSYGDFEMATLNLRYRLSCAAKHSRLVRILPSALPCGCHVSVPPHCMVFISCERLNVPHRLEIIVGDWEIFMKTVRCTGPASQLGAQGT